MNFQQFKTFSERWTELTDQQNEYIVKTKTAIQIFVEKENESAINRGIYDCSVSLQIILNEISGNKTGEIPHIMVALEYSLDASPDSSEKIGLIVRQCVDDLVNEQSLLYVYDKQRVRSRIAELVRYFSFLKQRMDEDYSQSPGLTHMVKLHIRSRKTPKRNIKLRQALIDVASVKNQVIIEDFLRPIITDDALYEKAFSNLRQMLQFYFQKNPADIYLSSFQTEGFRQIFRSSISRDFKSTQKSFIIQSSTGSGKTETFLLPILLYTLMSIQKKGTKALLIYPRIDLCNDQLQRLVRLVYEINNHADSSHRINIGIDHSGTKLITLPCPHTGCNGHISFGEDNPNHLCDCDPSHRLNFILQKRESADIIITTPDSLHRRLMDKYGKRGIWDNKRILPKFIVFDEAHIYTNQSGMHVANIIRRLRHKIKAKSSTEPIFIASSATIGSPTKFARRLFSTDEVLVIRPDNADLEEKGREYVVFIKATYPRRITIRAPDTWRRGGTRKKTQVPDADIHSRETERVTIATNLSAMIQIAFCFYHAMLKVDGKDRIIGFVDSIDVIKRLGDKLCDAEGNRQLYRLRIPDQKLGTSHNPQCPHIPCNNLPPNPYTNRCQTYLDGECWWVMEQGDSNPMNINMHKSGLTCDCRNARVQTDDWDMMITTSALEVGFDHPSVIGTFQYMAPMNIPGFVQRIGRGGRSPSDMPVSVVVLGTRPLDNFYFHHTILLTNPGTDKLEIPLDPDNRYVMSMHIVSFIYDYISTITTTEEDVKKNYYDLDIRQTLSVLNDNRANLLDQISRVFQIPLSDASEIVDSFADYLNSWLEKVDYDGDNSPLIEKVRFVKDRKTIDQIQTDILQTIVRMGGSL